MHKSAHSNYKEFLGPLPKPLCYNLLHIVAQFECVSLRGLFKVSTYVIITWHTGLGCIKNIKSPSHGMTFSG